MGLPKTQRLISSKKNRSKENGQQKTTIKLPSPLESPIFLLGKSVDENMN
jgi:hypothetical protein